MITVASFTERHASIEKQCQRLGLEPTFILEFDPEEARTQIEFEMSAALPLATRSTLLKHLAAQKRLINSDDDIALVLEDDAILFDDFLGGLSKAMSFAVTNGQPSTIFLGGADNKLPWPERLDASHEIVCGNLTTAEAYLIDREGSEKRLHWLKNNQIDLAADHLMKHVDLTTGVHQFRCIPPIATQGSITGRFKTTLDNNRGQKSSVYLRIRFELRKLFRMTLRLFILKLKSLLTKQ